MLCCPDCAIQYPHRLGAASNERRQGEMRAYEKRNHFFIGENKPWS